MNTLTALSAIVTATAYLALWQPETNRLMQSAVHETQYAMIDTDDDELPEENNEEEKSKSKVFRRILQRAMQLLRVLLVFVISILIRFVSLLLKLFLAQQNLVISGWLDFLCTFLLFFLILLLIACCFYRIAYPGRSLKELLTKKNLLLLACTAFVLTVLCSVSKDNPSQNRTVMILIETIMTILFLGYLWYRLFDLSFFSRPIFRKFLRSYHALMLMAFVLLFVLGMASLRIWLLNSPYQAYTDVLTLLLSVSLVFLYGLRIVRYMQKNSRMLNKVLPG